MQDFIISLSIIILALIIDSVFGDPPNKFHPTAWMGKLIESLKPHFRSKNSKIEKLNGVLLAMFLICIFTVPIYFALSILRSYSNTLVYIATSAIILKLTFAVRGMERASVKTVAALRKSDIQGGRKYLSHIVRRDTSKLNERLMLSATIESVSESTVDGITSPFFYFALFGVPGAVAFRVVNTLDSIVGYKSSENVNIGWFSARLDSILNYIPARLTAGFIVVSASILKGDCKNSLRILKRDNDKTESVNAGWPMSAMAGALQIKLEKPEHYTLGDNLEAIRFDHVFRALSIMKLVTLLFLAMVIIPICFIKCW